MSAKINYGCDIDLGGNKLLNAVNFEEEITNRKTAIDTANGTIASLSDNIDSEAATRQTADNDESTSRIAADNDLQSKITAEITNRETAIDTAVTNLEDGVSTDGDTLQKLYNLIQGSFTEITVANITARDAYNVTLGYHVFVTDDGDGRWSLYKAITGGVGATYVKLSDPDLLNAVMTASQIKTAYESNSDTNAFTNALLSKLNGIAAGATANDTDINLKNRANHTGTQDASTITGSKTSSFISDFGNTVRATVLTGIDLTVNAVISGADTILSSLGKLQKQITDLTTTVSGITIGSNPDKDLATIQALGAPLIAQTASIESINGVCILNSAICQIRRVMISSPQTISNVWWYQYDQGVYTSNNYNGAGLYSYSGGNITLVASTVNDGNMWKAAANTFNSKAFSTPYSAVSGIYFVVFYYNASSTTTHPSIGGGTSMLTNISNASFLTNSAKLSGSVNTQITLMTTKAMSAIGNLTTTPWVGLS